MDRFPGLFLGSGIGGMLRHGVGLLALRFTGANFPWGTLVINVVGSALMGLMIGLFAARSINDPELRLFVTTGLIGGFTTWSTFSLDIVTLWERGEIGSAIAYAAASIVLSLTVLAIALLAARRWG
ncbi:camphor resistance protein CrcB [Sphingomonas melonis]|uniref:Fluoride-specific ion channel FluC n=1 Tax=Sphingomonas melonis TaxID=152682 RepID=A0A0D1K031_9SPHN|nr:fluoride efflux transporter CrcB [Sphingomonas melonis]KIU26843.1 camphor resistance protein CrcB [Sphingomonas melonis]